MWCEKGILGQRKSTLTAFHLFLCVIQARKWDEYDCGLVVIDVRWQWLALIGATLDTSKNTAIKNKNENAQRALLK